MKNKGFFAGILALIAAGTMTLAAGCNGGADSSGNLSENLSENPSASAGVSETS